MDEEFHLMLYSMLWQKVGLDMVHMAKNTSFGYFVAMQNDFSGWVEAKVIRHADAKTIAAFIYEWFCRLGILGQIVFDRGGENKSVARELMQRYNTHNVPIAAYRPQSNGLI